MNSFSSYFSISLDRINVMVIIFLNLFFRLENLAWATAQIHCYCTSTNDEKLNDSNPSKTTTKILPIVTADTALNTQQGQGNVVLETEPKILFCDLRLSPGETKSCKLLFQQHFLKNFVSNSVSFN